MKADQPTPTSIDGYIADFPEPIRGLLRKVRATIQKAAPDAKEAIKYRMPTFVLGGNLVHFAAFKGHIGFFPAASGIARFQSEISGYESSKGGVQFPFDRPIPFDLITRIVEFRVAENLQRLAVKTKRPAARPPRKP